MSSRTNLITKSNLRKNILKNSLKILVIFYTFVPYEITIHEQVRSNLTLYTKNFLIKLLMTFPFETVNLLRKRKTQKEFSLFKIIL